MSDSQDSESLSNVSATFRSLRNINGHFSKEPGEFNPAVDSLNGEKHESMQRLSSLLGTGTPVQNVLEAMDIPDLIVPASKANVTTENEENADLLQFINTNTEMGGLEVMPGPIIGGSVGGSLVDFSEEDSLFVYFWRWKRDFLWFLIDGQSQRVKKNGWFYGYEL
ncbi:hypothetical protein HK098_001521 [Nowakowskiella sp. JEL0407]|nr:hypothetical protein HK098_001521 [Nowakowskiella sp. JEL0407]